MPYKSQNWTTKDYFDPIPGWEIGLKARALNQQQDAQRQGMEMRREENATQAQQAAEGIKMRQAEILSRMDVEPVMGADGGIDWVGTRQRKQVKDDLNTRATALGQLHGLQPPTSISQEENQLMQSPQYQKAMAETMMKKRMADDKQAAVLEQIENRGKAMIEQIEERNQRQGAGLHGTVSGVDPNNPEQRISFQIGADEARQRLQGGQAQAAPDKFEQAYERLQKAEGSGEFLDFDTDKDGNPVITKSGSWGFHDAKPSDPASYDKLRKKMDAMRKKNLNGGGAPLQSGSQRNAAPRLVYPGAR